MPLNPKFADTVHRLVRLRSVQFASLVILGWVAFFATIAVSNAEPNDRMLEGKSWTFRVGMSLALSVVVVATATLLWPLRRTRNGPYLITACTSLVGGLFVIAALRGWPAAWRPTDLVQLGIASLVVLPWICSLFVRKVPRGHGSSRPPSSAA